VRGVDLSVRRIAMARRAASRLGIENVAYEEGDARTFKGDGEVAAAYMLDIVHHIAPDNVAPLLRRLHACLSPRGVLIVKDVDTRGFARHSARRRTGAGGDSPPPRSPDGRPGAGAPGRTGGSRRRTAGCRRTAGASP